jgi:hypothetical protein
VPAAKSNLEVCFAKLLVTLRDQLNTITSQIQETRDAVTHPDAKAESKYDTRALEASYYALGQSKRAAELLDFIRLVERKSVRGRCLSLVENKTKTRHLILLIQGPGAQSFAWNSTETVSVVSESSPLGQLLASTEEGDELSFKGNNCEVKNDFD